MTSRCRAGAYLSAVLQLLALEQRWTESESTPRNSTPEKQVDTLQSAPAHKMRSMTVVDVGVSHVLGSRETQEDRYVTLNPGTLKSSKDLALFAVFDGHGSQESVDYVCQNLVTLIETQFSATSRDLEPDEYRQGIQRALRAVDKDLDRLDLRGGCTVALALIDVRRGVLVEIDLGDSHVVFADHHFDSVIIGGSEDGSAVSGDNEGWKVDVLSVEHSPDHPEERKRVEDAGGQINYITGIPRIGGVSMARALGDVQYKKPRVNRLAGHDLSDLVGIETGVAPGKTVSEDLVSNKAHFTIKHIQSQSLILLASDGVGDSKSAEELTKYALERWQQGQSAEAIATEITSREETIGNGDNCTVVIVVIGSESKGRRSIENPRLSLEVPTKQRRRSSRNSMARLRDWLH